MVSIFLLPILLLPSLTTANDAINSFTVSLSYGTFRGFSSGNLTQFLGVPFGQAGRFEPLQAPKIMVGLQNATAFGPACPQQALTPQPVFYTGPTYPSISEDCFTLNVFKPTASESMAKLPVFVWIYGGGFQLGNSRDADVTPMVERSIETGEPVIIVTPNYRVSAFGFLAGKEVGAAGISNLGLRDQIFALKWVQVRNPIQVSMKPTFAQEHVSAFGGDPARVVIGGQSAGAISASFLTLSNKQNSSELFRGLIAQSGPAFHVPSLADGQSDYDSLVAANNCCAAVDTLECLRGVPFDSLMATINNTKDFFSYSSLNLSWIPRIDSDVVVRDPFVSISQGLYAKIPFMSGLNDDEGTLFSYSTLNITADKEFTDYAHSNYLADISQAQMAQVTRLYPDNPTEGSPFDTGTAYQLTPEYKRTAAFQGDLMIVSPRRFWLEHASLTQNAWAWLNRRGKDTALGAYHGSDILIWFPPNITDETPLSVDAMVNFVNTLNPNIPAADSTANIPIFWPTWNTASSTGSSSLWTFYDSNINITAEDFRVEQIDFLSCLRLEEAGASSTCLN